jgi:hypothetical protein
MWFASDRLVEDGHSELNTVHNAMGSLMGGLLVARRNDALSLAKRLKDEAERFDTEKKELEAKLAAQDTLIAFLQSGSVAPVLN